MVFGFGFSVSFVAFFVGLVGLMMLSTEDVPIQKHASKQPLGAKRYERISEMHQAMDDLERSTRFGRFADLAARSMTLFGVAFAATAGLFAVLNS